MSKKQSIIPADRVTSISRVGDNISFLKDWSRRNEHTFEMVMERLAEELPQKFAEIYIKVKQIEMANAPQPKTTNNIEKVNIQLSKLDALGDVKDSSWRECDTQYEEIK